MTCPVLFHKSRLPLKPKNRTQIQPDSTSRTVALALSITQHTMPPMAPLSTSRTDTTPRLTDPREHSHRLLLLLLRLPHRAMSELPLQVPPLMQRREPRRLARLRISLLRRPHRRYRVRDKARRLRQRILQAEALSAAPAAALAPCLSCHRK